MANLSPNSRTNRKVLRRQRSAFHCIAFKQQEKLRAIKEREENEEEEELDQSTDSDFIFETLPGPLSQRPQIVREAKLQIFCALTRNGGGTDTIEFRRALDTLLANYDASTFDPRLLVGLDEDFRGSKDALKMEGTWITISRPSYRGCLGLNENNDYMYTLDHMSFASMFQPPNLVCSIQAIFNVVDIVDANDEEAVRHVPSRLLAYLRESNHPVRSFHVVTAFTVEPSKPRFGNNSPNKFITEPIEGIITTRGFITPFPKNNRFSASFTGGTLEVNGDAAKYHCIFNNNETRRSLAQKGKQLAAKLLMGASGCDNMDENGRISYELKRPMTTYMDMLYLDEHLRIMRSNTGEVSVLQRVPPDVLRDHSHAYLPGSRDRRGPPTLPKRNNSITRKNSPPQRPLRSISPPPSPNNSQSEKPMLQQNICA